MEQTKLPHRIIIAGSREIASYVDIQKAVEASGFEINEVVSGCARGADRFGEIWARKHDIPVKRFPADWEKYGKSAGFKRNAEMVEYATGLIAVPKVGAGNRGTMHCIGQATEKGIPVFVWWAGSEVTNLKNLR